MKLATVMGTRPEIIKLSRLIPLLDRQTDHQLVFTGQHYSENMVDVFFDELRMRKPDKILEPNSSKVEDLAFALKPALADCDWVQVYGDTNSTLAAAIAAKKLGKKIIHAEAGLRSFDPRMPEEYNRVETDKISDLLLAPTPLCKKFLEREKVRGKKTVTGNLIVDACKHYLPLAEKTRAFQKLGLEKNEYLIATAHRSETVDRKQGLAQLLKTLEQRLPVVFPIHPRTKKMMEKFGLKLPKNVVELQPTGYLKFLNLLNNAKAAMTDSGGVVEECTTLNVPCIVLRDTTERQDSVVHGSAFLSGLNERLAKTLLQTAFDSDLKKELRKKPNPYGENVAEKIAQTIQNEC